MLPTWSYGFSYDGFFSKHTTKGQSWNDEMMVPVDFPRAMWQVLAEA
jgi:hypothetical protein